ncbi:MAG: hypothetical protein KAR83_00820 [Thermodesulfovibrionales bacterium]|nr:hypothetical protein [Thermodesulfovibrionales bacterium]
MALIKALWRGDIPLAKTFWIFAFGVNVLTRATWAYLIYLGVLATRTGVAFAFLLSAFLMIYVPFIYIATWRSAGKYKGPMALAIIAKFAIMMGWADYIRYLLELASGLFPEV